MASTVDDTAPKPKLTGRGGAGRGQGRKKGQKNRTKSELDQYMENLLNKRIAEGSGAVTSLDLLQTLYKDKKVPFVIRNAAMRAALPYEAAKLQPTPPQDDPNKDKPFEHRMQDARRSLLSKLTPQV